MSFAQQKSRNLISKGKRSLKNQISVRLESGVSYLQSGISTLRPTEGYRVARKFCGSFTLRIDDFFWFAGTNFCGSR